MITPRYAWLVANAITAKSASEAVTDPATLMQMAGMLLLTTGALQTNGYQRLSRAWSSLTREHCENDLYQVRACQAA